MFQRAKIVPPTSLRSPLLYPWVSYKLSSLFPEKQFIQLWPSHGFTVHAPPLAHRMVEADKQAVPSALGWDLWCFLLSYLCPATTFCLEYLYKTILIFQFHWESFLHLFHVHNRLDSASFCSYSWMGLCTHGICSLVQQIRPYPYHSAWRALSTSCLGSVGLAGLGSLICSSPIQFLFLW